MMHKKFVILSFVSLLVTACTSSQQVESKTEFPGTQEEQRRTRLGALGGGDGLLKFGGRDKEDESGTASGIGVNSYIWRATLDTLSFMPFISADPFGGIIITDWYEDPKARGERFKMTIVMMSATLRSDAVKVSVFKQRYHDKAGWQDAEVTESLSRDLENKILTRARQLRAEKE
jgi:hypothetical protein